MAPFMKFYGYMIVAYLLLSVIWFSRYMRFRKDILLLQRCISAFIARLASQLLDVTEYVETVSDISERARLFLVLPYAFLDAFLILWIFTSLSKTLEQLQAKRIYVKLDLCIQFSNALVVAVITSIAWITYEVYFKVIDPFNESYAYKEDALEEFDDQEAQSLTRGNSIEISV
ncbi:hypothetical protein PTKIN_Ptkin10aG0084200 [Pterospermum kingtungense]